MFRIYLFWEGLNFMNLKKIYLCSDSIDGIFTAIYTAWNSRYGHNNIKIQEKNDNNYADMELFSEYITVVEDLELSFKVAQTIKDKISEEAYQMVCRVALSNSEWKADLIYRFLIIGFHMGIKVLEHLSNEVISDMYQIDKYVNNETHHFLGFLRFLEQDNGLLTSVIHPKNNVISLITPHFVDRLPKERFVIFDNNRNVASLHMPGKPWILAEANEVDLVRKMGFSKEEDEYSDLWRTFFRHVVIEERINHKLQRNNLPLRFRNDITEFNQ